MAYYGWLRIARCESDAYASGGPVLAYKKAALKGGLPTAHRMIQSQMRRRTVTRSPSRHIWRMITRHSPP